MNEPRILVFGCGGIGGYVSGMLTKGGADVTVVDIWPEHVICTSTALNSQNHCDSDAPLCCQLP